MKINKIKTIGLMAFLAVVNQSCVKEDKWDIPISKCENKLTPTKKLAEFKSSINGHGTKIEDSQNVIFDGYVVSSDEQGNLYKVLYIQDQIENPTAAVQIGIDKGYLYTDYPVGSHVRIKANGLMAGYDTGVFKLGYGTISGIISFSKMNEYISGVCVDNMLDIKTIIPKEVKSIKEAEVESLVGTLVKIKGVQFKSYDGTYADAINKKNKDITIVDREGNEMVIRNSGYAKFASQELSKLSGDIVILVSKYNKIWQGYIRSLSDVQFNQERFKTDTPSVSDTFDDAFNDLNNWKEFSIKGNEKWSIDDKYGKPKPCVSMSGFLKATKELKENEDWLVTKNPFDLTNVTEASISFDTDLGGKTSDGLEVYVSYDYNGDVGKAKWEKLKAKLDTNVRFNTWISTDKIDISKYKGKKIYIAFKYTSSTTSANTWEIDNFKLFTK